MSAWSHPLALGSDHCGGPGICPTCSAIYAQQIPELKLSDDDGAVQEPPC